MAVPLEKFVEQLEATGILAEDTIKDFIPPKASPKDVEELARELVLKQKLTKFQAQELYRGNGKSLVLGNCVLLEKIGAGGMGQVFKARHRVMDLLVAVKVLHAATAKDKAAIARFHREVKAAAKLSHPNIVAARDADESNGVHFLVMELVDGSDLSALVKKNGPFSVEKAVNYVLQAAKGLEFAHQEGVVHRDIKPANLLLDKKGTVKILDMGLARLNGDVDGPAQAELTSTGTIMGTVDYMSPEQATDTKNADARTDIYALGCSLHYLLTGKTTYGGDTLMAKLLAHREQPIPALRSIRPEVSEQLDVVFRKLVAKKVEDRYQSMTEVIAELERCTAGLTTSVTIQQPTTTTVQDGSFDFLKTLPDETTRLAKAPKKLVLGSGSKDRNKLMSSIIGAALLGLAILTGIIVSLQTKDGTLIVEVDQPDAIVQVLDAEGKVEISQKGGTGTVSISVDPGKHRLKVEKEGFTIFGQDFEMKSGGKTPITAKLVPLEEKPAMLGEAAVDEAKKPLFFQTPAFEPWAKEVASLPAEQQIEAVSKKLVELNPGFDGKVTVLDRKDTPSIENGAVTVFGILTDNVTDISPVRGLMGLRKLYCLGSDSSLGKLVDLSPLTGMPLNILIIEDNQVVDLSPLKGMPLSSLYIKHNRVVDLSPLTGLKLRALECMANKIVDLSPLHGMPLVFLNLNSNQVVDLFPLKGMPLWSLSFYSNPVTDLTPLSGMPLTELDCRETQVSNLSPLQGMSLERFVCNLTDVSDLTPLKGMPLKSLGCSDTRITDLTPLHGMPLEWMEVSQSDLSPLEGMNLKHLLLAPGRITKGVNVIRNMQSLETIGLHHNGNIQWPPAEFWKKYDAGEFGKPKSE